ncbi:MAG: hypothetical protein WCW46_03910, partial [Candidatus Paceibacterota bacterium]
KDWLVQSFLFVKTQGIECRSQTRNGFDEAGLEAIFTEIDRRDSRRSRVLDLKEVRTYFQAL